MESFTIGINPYNFIWYKDFTPDLLPPARIYKKSKYFDVGSGFDIETTNFERNEKHYASMYCWQWSFNELTVIGRTWTEFKDFVIKIVITHFHHHIIIFNQIYNNEKKAIKSPLI